MIGVLVGLLLLTMWGLNCYTRHGESVQVNDFTDMRLVDAQRQAKDKSFEFEIMDSVWIQGKPGGMILNQTPKPLSMVKEGRKIYITLTQWNADMVTLPLLSMSGYDYDQYSAKLRNHKIRSRIKERVYDRRQAENTIEHLYYEGKKLTEDDIKKGFEIPAGSTLDFVVTERRSNRVEIPDLICQTFEAAEFLASASNLIIGEIIEDETVGSRGSAYVVRQEPAPDNGTMIKMGGEINIWLSKYPSSDCDNF